MVTGSLATHNPARSAARGIAWGTLIVVLVPSASNVWCRVVECLRGLSSMIRLTLQRGRLAHLRGPLTCRSSLICRYRGLAGTPLTLERGGVVGVLTLHALLLRTTIALDRGLAHFRRYLCGEALLLDRDLALAGRQIACRPFLVGLRFQASGLLGGIGLLFVQLPLAP